jgi:ribosomal protein S18 acetylase RimI-like enzyme
MTVACVPLPVERWREAADLLARSFVDDPALAAVVRDPARRVPLQAAMFGPMLRMMLVDGRVDTTPTLQAVAVWAPPGRRVRVAPAARAVPLLPGVLRTLRPSDVRPLISLSRIATRSRALVPGPHWHLHALGVEPSRQRFGLGAVLVRAGLQRADDDGKPAFLEALTESNYTFYRKLGFDLLEHTPAEHEPLGIPVWRMLYTPAVRPSQ